jgi:Na+-transporting NADH:ubiquinone oxidoreductase subunit NqrF
MKRLIIVLGIVISVVGLIGLIHPTFTYHQKKEVAKLGPVQATMDEEKTATMPPGVSVLLLVAGAGLALFGAHTKKAGAS